jgi:hypothetical protein
LNKEDLNFRLPLAALRGSTDSHGIGMPGFKILWVVHRVSSAAEPQKLLGGAIYVTVDFYTDYDGTHREMAMECEKLAKQHAIPGILEFAKANIDDMRDVVKKYCNSSDGNAGV